MKSWRQRSEQEKTTAERMPLLRCSCGHYNTIHAGGFGNCAGLEGSLSPTQCPCPQFTPATEESQ